LLANKANNLAFDLFHQLLGLEKKAESKIPDAIRKAHSVGITTLHALEGSPEGDDMVVGAFWNMIPDLPLRFVLYYQTLDVDKVVELGLPRIGGCILLHFRNPMWMPRTATEPCTIHRRKLILSPSKRTERICRSPSMR
jgi:hypothetical protein